MLAALGPAPRRSGLVVDVLIAVLALLISAACGWPVVEGILALARIVPEDTGTRDDLLIEPKAPPERHVLRGGAVIGVLERVATTGLVLVGQAGLIAAVIAVKSLGRWSELRDDPAVSERFIIGSLASYLWAGTCGFVGLLLIT